LKNVAYNIDIQVPWFT